MVWHIKKTSMMGASVEEQFITKVIIVGQKPKYLKSCYIYISSKSKSRDYIWERKQPQVGMLPL